MTVVIVVALVLVVGGLRLLIANRIFRNTDPKKYRERAQARGRSKYLQKRSLGFIGMRAPWVRFLGLALVAAGIVVAAVGIPLTMS